MRRVIVFALLALCAIARADDDPTKPSYRAVIDRVDYEPSAITGYRLRVYLSALAIDGQLLDLTDPKSIKLYVGGGAKQVPYALGTWNQAGGELAIVLVVQATADFAETLPTIGQALDTDILGALPDKTTQAALLTYGETTGAGKLAPVKQLRGKLGALASDGTAGDPALLDTLDRALLLLKKAKTDPEGRPMRKVIVIVGDGRDRSGDKDRATKLAQRAAREGVRIHSIAYSPNDVRRPLLYLGELSKKSLGTFRWPGRGHRPTPESWSDTMKQLRDEIAKQYVITYFVGADDDVAGKKLHIATVGRTETHSNETKVPTDPTCNGTACEAGYCAADVCVDRRDRDRGGGLARPDRVRDDEAPAAASPARRAQGAQAAEGAQRRPRDAADSWPVAERQADSGAADPERPTCRRAPSDEERVSDRQTAGLRPPDRGRLHVEPARADLDGRGRKLSTVRSRLDKRDVRQRRSHRAARAVPRHASQDRLDRPGVLGTMRSSR